MKKIFRKQPVSYRLIHQMYPEYEDDKFAALAIFGLIAACFLYLYTVCHI